MGHTDNTQSHRAATNTLEMAAASVKANMPNSMNLSKKKEVKAAKACAMCGQAPCICKGKKMKAGGPGSGRKPGFGFTTEDKTGGFTGLPHVVHKIGNNDADLNPDIKTKGKVAQEMSDAHGRLSQQFAKNDKLSDAHGAISEHFDNAASAYKAGHEKEGDSHYSKAMSMRSKLRA